MIQVLKRLSVFIGFFVVLAGFGIVTYVICKSADPENHLIKLLVDKDQKVARALFSPDDKVAVTLIDLMRVERKRIVVAIYTITHKEIAQALIEASQRGVLIEVVVDPSYGTDRYSKVPLLANNKIPIWVYQSPMNERESSIMHNKFCVFEDNILHKTLIWTGSYNFTMRASTRNQENVIILDNEKIAKQYLEQFEELKTRSLLINGTQRIRHYPKERANDYGFGSFFKELRNILSI
jgi:phosphatidylserine/phosphatidylglycerophosphate/cardiolipin synthase-like enzyme